MTPIEKLASQEFSFKKTYKELDGLSPLFYAAKHNIANYITDCFSTLSKPDVENHINFQNSHGLTALHYACLHGSIDAAKVLLSYGAENKKTYRTQQLPIHMIFSDHNSQETCEALFELLHSYGIEKDYSNQTIGHLAAIKGNIKILSYLSINYPNILNQVDNFSLTPLLAAVLNNQIGAVDFLLKHSQYSISNSKGQNALHLAVSSSTIEMINCLLPFFDPNSLDLEKNSALDLARKLNFKDKELILLSRENSSHSAVPHNLP